jgi:hypothetical protein
MSQLPVPNPPNPATVFSGSIDQYAQSAGEAIEFAMRNASLLDKLDQPDSEDYRQYMPRLNGLINFEQTQGLKLWLQEDISFTPVEGQQSYAWGPTGDVVMTRPTRIIAGYFTYPLIDTSNIQVRFPLYQLSRDEFNNLGVLNVQGITNSFFVDKQQNNVIVWLWLNPDAFTAEAVVTFTTQVQVNQIISITDTTNFPIEWFQFIHWALACEIDQGQPSAVQAKNESMRDYYRDKLEGFDVEDTSTYIQPDTRLGFTTGRFA